MNFYTSLLLSVFVALVFLPLNALACACCAEPGHYQISFQKPGKFELGELKRMAFSDAKLFTTVAYPDDIKGLEPLGEEYEVSGTKSPLGWSFEFKDENGKSGRLELKMPKKFLDYSVDTRSGEKGSAGTTILYKEWRFKDKVKTGTGIFQNGIKGAEYFLVLQGRGNLCTEAEQFTNWRLEITGKKASYAFYGDLKTGSAVAVKKVSPKTKPAAQTPIKSPVNSRLKNFLKVSNLTGSGYSGCGCSGWTPKKLSKARDKTPMFWSEFRQGNDTETLFMNLNGKDTELRLIRKETRPDNEKVGDKFTDEYLAKNGTKVILEYTTKKLPCAECEGTDYSVIATVVGEFNGKVLTLDGSCGC